MSFFFLFVRFWKLNIPNKDDVEWTKHIGDVVTNREDRLPELGKYNAGQKGVFWGQTALIGVMFVTGLVIWNTYFGGLTTIETQRWALLAHSLAAVIAIAIIVVHIYAGIWVRGTGRAMVRGTVTGGWAYRITASGSGRSPAPRCAGARSTSADPEAWPISSGASPRSRRDDASRFRAEAPAAGFQ